MLDLNVQKMDFLGNNTIFSRVVNLDNHLDLMVLISVKDEKFWEVFLNKILDATIDRISVKNTYSDFSTALENINAFLNAWKDENEKLKWVHAIIAVLHKKELLFSTLGSPSSYLVNAHKDVVEITDKEEKRKDFGFISSWEISDNETIMFATTRLLNYLSKWDILDSATLASTDECNENIKSILESEKPKKNIWLLSFRYEPTLEEVQEESRLSKLSYQMFKYMDNHVVKTILGYWIILKKKLLLQSKQSKNMLFLWWMVVCAVFLYIMLSGVIGISNKVSNTEQYKQQLLTAREHVRLASENITNPDIFELQIESSENLVKEIQDQNLFANDIEKIQEDISILKKQFNGIETFIPSEQTTIFESESLENPVKVLGVAGKIYIVDQMSVIWPVIAGQEPEVHTFDQIQDGDSFIDASVQDSNIVIMTSLGKVVNFARNNFFTYLDVEDQPTWEESNIISGYGQNLYLLWKERNQIYRHKKSAGKYGAWVPYIAEQDQENVGVILSLAIDGGIYILKEDLSILKLFVSPQYRLETMALYKTPKNYVREDEWAQVSIYTAANLNYFYMLLDNRVLAFKPNTTRFQDTKWLTYIWQVEAQDFDIREFYVENDKEIYLLSDQWLYKMGFEVSDGKLLVR